MFASASSIATPLRGGSISEILSQPKTFSLTAQHLASSTCAVTPAFETLTAVHHLQTIADLAEYSETETEDDDDASAHFLTTTAFHSMRLAASCFSNAPPDGIASYSVPLYILHHCWKLFPANI